VATVRALGPRRTVALALVVFVGLAVAGWAAARQIRSPARIAAETAAPKASPITVPVARRTLAAEVIVRGTVRYGDPQTAVLATSKLKQGSDIVTRPPRRRAQLGAGRVAMTVDGRPTFVLPGAIPMHRDLTRGDHGPDVRQLERALAALGFAPGAVDGRYDARTAGAVSAFYLNRGWDPFGPTDLQLEQLRTAQAAAAQARDAHLQALNTAVQATRGATAAEIEQARFDVVTARSALDAARLAAGTARAKLVAARSALAAGANAEPAAQANQRRDQAAADADIAAKQAALNKAIDDQRIAEMKVLEVSLDAPPSDREAAAAAAREAADVVAQAQADLAASVAAAGAVRTGGPDALQRAHEEARQRASDVRAAETELRQSNAAVRTARLQLEVSDQRVRALSSPADNLPQLLAITAAAAQEELRTRSEVARLARESDVQVPANEVLFFPSLPLRVDAVKARRGSTAGGSVMTVTGSDLAIDSSLSVADAKLVHAGDPVIIEEQDLGVRAHGTVTEVATTPGTNRVDPSRFYLRVTPSGGLPQLVGASVKLTIAVKSTEGAVLAVPVSALSVGGDGRSRVQVRRGGRTELLTVVPGLAAEGLAEVRPVGNERLRSGDLVIVGNRR
jgi:peptidoglycan hydrolase-like protein with peptidoglycan-binding domain